MCDGRILQLANTDDVSLKNMSLENISADFKVLLANPSLEQLTRFLCGIPSPIFYKTRASSLEHFGVLSHFKFNVVRDWVE